MDIRRTEEHGVKESNIGEMQRCSARAGRMEGQGNNGGGTAARMDGPREQLKEGNRGAGRELRGAERIEGAIEVGQQRSRQGRGEQR
jgi:hypothetical protein